MDSSQTHRDHFIHEGKVASVLSNSIVVVLDQNIECAGCHARGACGVSESHHKEIEVYTSPGSFQIHERVRVQLKKATGMKAVFWAYIFPFLMMSSTLIITSQFLEEWLAGLLSLSILAPYYLTLYLFKNQLKQRFQASVLKT
jgi:sigma-E factor negative regulatory protein RseC